MKTLVVYDSNYGNTKIIAEKISFKIGNSTKVISVDKITDQDLVEVKFLIVGSPIIGWRPTEKMNKWLGELTKNQLIYIKAVTYDTRIKLFIHGDAAKKIAKELKKAGAEIIDKPKGFIVLNSEGPLADGEIERAENWIESILKSFQIQ